MPKKRVSAKKTEKNTVPVPPPYVPAPKPEKKPLPWRAIAGGLLVLLILLLSLNKGVLVAAMVNGKPIFSWDLYRALKVRHGEQTLEGMIGERLIADEAQKQGVAVTQSDIEVKQQEVLGNLGPDVNLEDLLKFQGMTREDFVNQLRLQLTVEQLLTRDLVISDNDIDNYIATNRASLTATDPAKLKEEARQAIKNSFVSERLQSWFGEVRDRAAVTKFL